MARPTARFFVQDRTAAEDLVQEAFIRLSRSLHRIDDPAAQAAYLRAIVLNLCRDHNRRVSGGRQSSRGDISAMSIEDLSKELAKLSADMERDIGKVYRKYERLERTIRAERSPWMAGHVCDRAGYSPAEALAEEDTRDVMEAPHDVRRELR